MFSRHELMIGEPICVAATGDVCGEGVLWERSSGCVYWTDINRFLVHRYQWKDAILRTWFFPEPVTCVMETIREGTLVLSLGSGVILWEPETDTRHEPIFRLPGWPRVRCNDAAVDPRGTLWLGSMRNNVGPDGAPGPVGGWDGMLCSINPGEDVNVVRSGIGIANTLVWTADRKKFYFGDSLRNCIWQYDYDLSNGSISAERPFFQGFERGVPDGSAIDSDGCVWNCRYGGSCIVRITPTGQIDRIVELPAANPTNCTFGGEQGNILFVTSAHFGEGSWERLSGCLFAFETNCVGVEAGRFKLPAVKLEME